MKKLIVVASLDVFLSGCGSKISPTPEVQNPQAKPTPVVSEVNYSLEQIQEANTREKCWSTINGTVYDLTDWIAEHPGGEKAIVRICGKDGTVAFQGQHGDQGSVAEILNGFKIGLLK